MSDGADPSHPTPGEPFDVPWSPLTAVGVFLLQFLVVAVLGAVLAGAQEGGVIGTNVQRVVLLPASSLAAAVLTLAVVARRYPGQTWRLRGPQPLAWRFAAVGLGYGLLAYAAVGLGLGSVLEALATAGGEELPEIQRTFREFAADPVIAPVFLVAAVLLAPLGEELLFRGMLFQALRTRMGLWPGIGLSGSAFALVHWDPTTTLGGNLLVMTTILALGMLLAWMFHRTGSLLVPVAAHCMFNAISAVLLVLTS